MAQAITIATSVLDVRAFGRAVGRGLTRAIRTVQMARMMSVLGQMSNEELRRIGITRQEIPAHAEKLVYGED